MQENVLKKLGLQPHIILWMYTAIMNPIITQEPWEAMNKAMNKNKLNQVQQLAVAIGIMGAIRITLQAPLKVMLVH